jgi:hypothetical protein
MVTQAAPREFQDRVGMPIQESLPFVHNMLIGAGIRDQLTLISSGKVFDGCVIDLPYVLDVPRRLRLPLRHRLTTTSSKLLCTQQPFSACVACGVRFTSFGHRHHHRHDDQHSC